MSFVWDYISKFLWISLKLQKVFKQSIVTDSLLLWNCRQVSSKLVRVTSNACNVVTLVSPSIVHDRKISSTGAFVPGIHMANWQIRHHFVRNLPTSEMRKHFRPVLAHWVDNRWIPLCRLYCAAFHCAIISVAYALTHCWNHMLDASIFQCVF